MTQHRMNHMKRQYLIAMGVLKPGPFLPPISKFWLKDQKVLKMDEQGHRQAKRHMRDPIQGPDVMFQHNIPEWILDRVEE